MESDDTGTITLAAGDRPTHFYRWTDSGWGPLPPLRPLIAWPDGFAVAGEHLLAATEPMTVDRGCSTFLGSRRADGTSSRGS